MEHKLAEYCKLFGRLKRLTEEINQLKATRTELEKEIIAGISGQNEEHHTFGKYEARIGYRRIYDFDIPTIRKILEPRRLFDEVSTLRIKQEDLTCVIATPGLLTDAEFEDMLNAMRIIEVREKLYVTKRSLGEIS